MDYRQHMDKRFREALDRLVQDEFGAGLPAVDIKRALEDQLKLIRPLVDMTSPTS